MSVRERRALSERQSESASPTYEKKEKRKKLGL